MRRRLDNRLLRSIQVRARIWTTRLGGWFSSVSVAAVEVWVYRLWTRRAACRARCSRRWARGRPGRWPARQCAGEAVPRASSSACGAALVSTRSSRRASAPTASSDGPPARTAAADGSPGTQAQWVVRTQRAAATCTCPPAAHRAASGPSRAPTLPAWSATTIDRHNKLVTWPDSFCTTVAIDLRSAPKSVFKGFIHRDFSMLVSKISKSLLMF